jgi:hypothetical protein
VNRINITKNTRLQHKYILMENFEQMKINKIAQSPNKIPERKHPKNKNEVYNSVGPREEDNTNPTDDEKLNDE